MPYLFLIGCSSRFFFFQAEDGIRDLTVTGVQTCALPIYRGGDWAQRQQLARCRSAGNPVGSYFAGRLPPAAARHDRGPAPPADHPPGPLEIGRASCRERV